MIRLEARSTEDVMRALRLIVVGAALLFALAIAGCDTLPKGQRDRDCPGCRGTGGKCSVCNPDWRGW
jgi:hypothetical protein